MGVFKTKWIILKINKPKDKDFLYTLFTYDFGKITVVKKKNSKEKLLDLWYVVGCEVRTKEWFDIHKVSNIKIWSEFNYENRNFAIIESYLELLSLVFKRTPNWNPIYEIFYILENINLYEDISLVKLTLGKLKILNCLWELDIENKDLTVMKILKFINTHSIKDVLRLSWIDENIELKLSKIVKSIQK